MSSALRRLIVLACVAQGGVAFAAVPAAVRPVSGPAHVVAQAVRRLFAGAEPKTALGRKLRELDADQALRSRLKGSVIPEATLAVAQHHSTTYRLTMTPKGVRLGTYEKSNRLERTWMNLIALNAYVPLMTATQHDTASRVHGGEDFDRAAALFPQLSAHEVYPTVERNRAFWKQ